MGDPAAEGEDAVDGKDTRDWEPRAGPIAIVATSTPAARRVRIQNPLGRCSCRSAAGRAAIERQRGVASTYALFDTPTICTGS
jgi:hypothetical protein